MADTYHGDPALFVLVEGFSYEGIQSLIAVYATEEEADDARAKHDIMEEPESPTWFKVIRVADQTGRSDLLKQWNREASSVGWAGSEFNNDPKRVFDRVRELQGKYRRARLDLAERGEHG